MNKGRESLDVSPQAQDQSDRDPLKKASSWPPDLSMSSKVRRLCSFHIHHIKHNKTKFQILDECFPNQFHLSKRTSDTVSEVLI